MNLSTSLDSSVNVLGNIPGNSIRATGSNSSMNGTMMNTENGTKRNMSAVVRTNYNTQIHSGTSLYYSLHWAVVIILSVDDRVTPWSFSEPQ